MRRFVTFLAAAAFTLGPTGRSFAKYDSKGKRDPFVPLLTSEGSRIHPPGLDEEVLLGVAGLHLQGIVFDKDKETDSYAIINGQVVRQHEEIEGMKILRIEPDAVTLLVEGQPHRLGLHEPTEDKATP